MSPATLKSALIASILGLAVVHAAEPWKILDVDFPDPAVEDCHDFDGPWIFAGPGLRARCRWFCAWVPTRGVPVSAGKPASVF